MLGTMSMRTNKRARYALDREFDMYSLSDEISEDESYGYCPVERVSSPKSALDMPSMLMGVKTFQSALQDDDDEAAGKRVTIWNWREQRKLSGNSAPFKKNLQDYLRKHPDWEEYAGQDKDENGKKNFAPKKRKTVEGKDIPDSGTEMVKGRKIKGNESPLQPVMPTTPRPATPPEAVARRRITDSSMKQRVQAEADAAWRVAREKASKQKEQEEKEALRWREFSAIQHIIDHYNQGPSKSPFVGDNAMMNA